MLTLLREMSSGYIEMQCCKDNCNAFNVVCNIAIKEREIKRVGGEKTFNTNPTQSKEQTNKRQQRKKNTIIIGHLVKMANIMLLPKWELPNNGSNQYFLMLRLWLKVQV